MARPLKAINPSPANGDTGIERHLTLSWDDGGGSTEHGFWFGTDPIPTSNIANFKGTTTSLAWGGIVAYFGVIYYWQIISFNDIGESTSGDIWRFTRESTLPPLTYILTTKAGTVGGSIRQPFCETDGVWVTDSNVSFPDECSGSYDSGTRIVIIPTPDVGYSISSWEYTTSTDPLTQIGDDEVELLMPREDVTITVNFVKDVVPISFIVGSGNGCLRYQITSTCNGGVEEIINITATSVRFYANPDLNWRVGNWVVNGSGTASTGSTSTEEWLDVSTIGQSSINVTVNFILRDITNCTTKQLTIIIEGNGTVSGESGTYCDDDPPKVLSPVSSNGYFFKEWIYNDSEIVLNGISLEFDMTNNRSVTAVFEKIVGYVEDDYSLFYCPSSISRTNTIDFNYVNLSPNPSISDNFHFRATFYLDPEKTQAIYSTFSLNDNRGWFYNDGSFRQIPVGGVLLEDGDSTDITYLPEVLPAKLVEIQREEVFPSSTTGFYLICGTRYYIDIEAYNYAMVDLAFVKSISLIVDCDDVDAFYSSSNNDKNNWICSGQGKSDFLITGDVGQSLFPAISSNHFGIFNVAWQSRRNNLNTIYSAMWDSNNDLLYSSGQGMYDTKIFDNGFKPVIIVDPSTSFYISSYSETQINYYYYPIKAVDSDAPLPGDPEGFERLCYPGNITELSSTIDDIIIRVYEEDTNDNLVINKDKVIPVVTKTDIRLDIDGTSALYAIRLRDSADSNWSDWINIDTALYETEGIDATIDAYKISDSRIIVPWTLDRINGVRRVCCQLLTLYGISPTICIDMFMNIDIIKYVFEFYSDSVMSNSMPIYNGLPIISPVRNGDGVIIGNGANAGEVDISTGEINVTDTTIYFKVLFSEDIIKTIGSQDYYNNVEYKPGDFTFNVVQQGIDDVWGGILTKINNRILKGSFVIYQHDGVFNKDGKAFIQIILSSSLGNSVSLTDKSDPYNLMLNSDDAGRYHDLVPEEVFNQYKTSQIGKALDINSFKQYYRIDDDNFRFGNPDFFRNDNQG